MINDIFFDNKQMRVRLVDLIQRDKKFEKFYFFS